jgi:nitrogen fixation protein NifU and related proteins
MDQHSPFSISKTKTAMPSPGDMSASLKDLYQEVIVDHSRRPRFKGKPALNCQFCQEGKNPLCGDNITLFCSVAVGKGNLQEPLPLQLSLAFEGHGCSISQASASMLCEAVQGLSVQDARTLIQKVEGIYSGKKGQKSTDDLQNDLQNDFQDENEDDIQEDVEALRGVSRFPVRVKCAALPWKTFELILDENFNEEGQLKETASACASLSSGSQIPCKREKRALRVVSTEDD